MRRVRYSKTFIEQLDQLLAQGEGKFGTRLADEKRILVYNAIDHYLAFFPQKHADAKLGLCHHSISKTPFAVLYDFDDNELRIYFIVHARADRSSIDPASVEW